MLVSLVVMMHIVYNVYVYSIHDDDDLYNVIGRLQTGVIRI